jgi:hypothetical protein
MIAQKDLNRFWAKVDKSGDCWEWMAYKQPYGQYWNGKRLVQAHRFSYELANGPIPDGLCVLHNCDNPGCVNPAHLFLGTQKDNIRDALEKGRLVNQKGENNPRSILTEKKVLTVRAEYKTGKTSCRKLGREHGIDYKHINNIINRKNWSHI